MFGINVHAAVIAAGDTETGITIHRVTAEYDAGDIILQKKLPIGADEKFQSLHDRMATLGGEALLEALAQIENGSAKRIPQDDSLSSYSPMIKKSDGKINWHDTSEKIINQVRALPCFTTWNGEALKIWGVEKGGAGENFEKISPGEIISSDELKIKTADGVLKITELQAVNKKRMPAEDFLRGQKIIVGESFN
jgi:methionyl-tRNA formyltransferase